jgi:DNA-binding GntR family transcriptional regulator
VAELTPRPLKRQTLGTAVAERLREMILLGELPPGRRTTQDELARALGVSTMPVREALLTLAAEGFVAFAPGRSFTIPATNRDDVEDVYWIHGLVAGELTRRACEAADEEFVERLARLAADCTTARDADAANWRFHEAINRLADAPKLLLVLRTTLRFIPDGFYALVPEWRRLSQQGHAAIVAAFREHDAEQAARVAEAHVRDAGRLLIELFSSRGYWARPAGSSRRTAAGRGRSSGAGSGQ